MNVEGPKSWTRKILDKREKELRDARPPEAGAETGPTIIQILADGKDNKMFGEMLNTKLLAARSDATKDALLDLAARIRSGKIEGKDVKQVETYRFEFLDIKDRVKAMHGTLDTRFDEMLGKSEDLEVACVTFGKENYLAVLKQGLEELAFSKPAEFKKIEVQLASLASSEAKINDPADPSNMHITDFQRKYSLSDDTITRFVSETDPAKRTEQIRQVFRDQMTWFDRLWDNRDLKKGRQSTVDFAKSISDSIDLQHETINNHLELIDKSGGLLVGLVNKDPKLLQALMSAKPGEEPKIEEGIEATMAFSEAKEQKIKASEVRTAWESFLDDRVISDFGSLPDYAKDALQNTFSAEFVSDKLGKHKGFWARVIERLLTNKLKNDPVLKSQLK